MGILNQKAYEVWEVAENAGWHKADTRPLERIALCHTELSEAVEAFRVGGINGWTEVDGKPQGWGSELIDTIIRIFELCVITDVDIDAIFEQKNAYNDRRRDVPARSDIKSV